MNTLKKLNNIKHYLKSYAVKKHGMFAGMMISYLASDELSAARKWVKQSKADSLI